MKRNSVAKSIYSDPGGCLWWRGVSPQTKRYTWKKLASVTVAEARKEIADSMPSSVPVSKAKSSWMDLTKTRPNCATIPQVLAKDVGRVLVFHLPKFRERPGVYFLMNGYECVYVGMSGKDVFRRVLQHLVDKDFDHFYFLPIQGDVLAAERRFIKSLRPRYNIMNITMV